jgi:hypothetical protein
MSDLVLAGEAGLLVRDANGNTERHCVAFDGDSTTGAELLERSGIDYVEEAGSLGTAICSIEGQGCGRDDCFCEYPTFWGYWTKDPGEEGWRFSDVGAADRPITHGSMDGWSFGKDGKPAPSERIAFDEICTAAAVSSPVEVPAPVATDYSRLMQFGAFVAFFVIAGLVAYRVRRRRTDPSRT